MQTRSLSFLGPLQIASMLSIEGFNRVFRACRIYMVHSVCKVSRAYRVYRA